MFYTLTGKLKNRAQPLRDLKKRKQGIMLVTTRLFRQKSFLNTTIDDIAANAGMNKITIYSFFKSKERPFGRSLPAPFKSILRLIER